MSDLPSVLSNWQLLYEAAMNETDRSKLPERIAMARAAILKVLTVQTLSLQDLRAAKEALADPDRLAQLLIAAQVA